MRPLYLASESPRRRELLEKAGFSFQVIPSKISEFPRENLTVDEQILDIARQKARAVANELISRENSTKVEASFYVLAADTEVVWEGQLSGKPLTAEKAIQQLQKLSGQNHQVKTGFVLICWPENKELSHLETTEVFFKKLSDEDIQTYVQSGEPLDKAGAYAIQGLGGKLVSEIRGSFNNVVGLPVEIVADLLLQLESFQEFQKKNSHYKGQVVAVSKLQPDFKIRSLAALGQKIFGENYVQEALDKQESLKDLDLEWHLIGHLQSKKVNSIIGRFALIHSVDSFELAKKISEKSQSRNLVQDILLQVNVAEESSKEGLSMADLQAQWQNFKSLTGVRLCGLMTMPPLNSDSARACFQKLRQLRDDLKKDSGLHPMSFLSMGTSSDYSIAIEEGATHIRIGTTLFGERVKK